jgi:hypothetical protein
MLDCDWTTRKLSVEKAAAPVAGSISELPHPQAVISLRTDEHALWETSERGGSRWRAPPHLAGLIISETILGRQGKVFSGVFLCNFLLPSGFQQ